MNAGPLRVLVVDDEPAILRFLRAGLASQGYVVIEAATGHAALDQIRRKSADLVVLDLGLPDIDGIRLLRMLRPVSNVPVIVATARDEDTTTVAALDAGADDYVVKPFSAEQLEARIRAVLRRSSTEQTPVLQVGDLVVDVRARAAVLAGQELDLRPREFDLLAYLAARPGEVVTKRTLLAEVWQSPYGGADKTVDVHLSWLRRKLGETAAEPRMLHSVRGVGVKLVAAARDEAQDPE